MTPLPAFRALQAIHANKTGQTAEPVGDTIRAELEQHHATHMDTTEHNFAYTLGRFLLSILTFGLISRALDYCEALNEFEYFAENSRTIREGLARAIVEGETDFRITLKNNLDFGINEFSDSALYPNDHRGHNRTIVITTNDLHSPVIIRGMSMRGLLEFIHSDMRAIAKDKNHMYSYQSIMARVKDREKHMENSRPAETPTS